MMTTLEGIIAAVTVVGGGGGIVALFKMRPEVARVAVSASEGAVIVQTGVITNLNNEIERLHRELKEEREICDKRLEAYERELRKMKEIVDAVDERRKKEKLNLHPGDPDAVTE